MAVILFDHILLLFSMVFLKDLSFFNILFLVFDMLFFEFLFVFLHVFHAILKVTILFLFGWLTIVFNIDVGLFLLILQKFKFLEEDFDFSIVNKLHVFSLGLFVENLGM